MELSLPLPLPLELKLPPLELLLLELNELPLLLALRPLMLGLVAPGVVPLPLASLPGSVSAWTRMGSTSLALTNWSGRRNGRGEGGVGVVLAQEALDDGQVDRAGDDVDAVGAHVGGQGDLAVDERVAAERDRAVGADDRALGGLGVLADAADGAARVGEAGQGGGAGVARRGGGAAGVLGLEEVVEELDGLGGVGALEGEEFLGDRGGGAGRSH